MNMRIPASQVASLDVDAQNTFTDLCPLELPVSGGQDIVPELNAQARFARYRVGSKDAHSPASLWVDTDKEPQLTPIANALDMDVRWKIHGVPGSAGFRLIDGLPAVRNYDFFVWKGIELNMHPYGACYHDLQERMSTGLIEWLQAKGVTTALVGGLASDFCVATTIRQLRKKDFTVVMNKAACRGIWAATTEDKLYADLEKEGVLLVDCAADLANIIDVEN